MITLVVYGNDSRDVMLDVICKMDRAHIGNPKKWNKMSKKISNDVPLSLAESEYYTRLTRIYRRPAIQTAHKTYHVPLSDEDTRPRCVQCSAPSAYYCHMNDQYLCQQHVVGHDPNE